MTAGCTSFSSADALFAVRYAVCLPAALHALDVLSIHASPCWPQWDAQCVLAGNRGLAGGLLLHVGSDRTATQVFLIPGA
jgi:hypothetical protein